MKNEFLKKYQINVIDTNRRCVKARPVSSKFFTEATDKDIIKQIPGYDSEPLLTITIPQSQLKRLEHVDDILFRNLDTAAHNNLLELVFEQKAQERQIRDQSAAVKQAYEHYSTLLHLAGYSDRTGLD